MSLRTNAVRRGAIAALGLALALSVTAPAAAQSPDEIKIARQTAGEAFGAYKTGDFEKAAKLFDQAKALYPSAQILRMHGYTHLALEHWQIAVDSLEAAMTSTVGPLSDADKKDVQSQLDKALAHFGTLQVTSKVAGAELVVDGGEPHKLPLDKPLRLLEGNHQLTARAPEHLDVTDEVVVQAGKQAEVTLDPAEKPKPKVEAPPPPPPPPPPPKKGWFPGQLPAGIAIAGTGAALGVAALITGIEGGRMRSSLRNEMELHTAFYGVDCAKGSRAMCQSDALAINERADRADALRDATIGLGIAGGVLAATGVVFIVMSPRDSKTENAPAPVVPPAASLPSRSSVSMKCGPGGAGLFCSGTF